MKLSSTPITLWGLSILFSVLVTSCDQDVKPSTSSNSESASARTTTKIEHIDVTGAVSLLASTDKPLVIDVRTPDEFGEGHIEGATMVDFKASDFESKLSELDRNQTYLVHCRSGGRSAESLPVFEKLGFKHIINLDGGITAWQEAGNPVVK
ncbi:MAG: rhodanese-like domain-containing protein [Verrucomicrobiales bacterium]|nr:rhodanese-like domain-containing protein [Verrucomicrobiales bacterium]